MSFYSRVKLLKVLKFGKMGLPRSFLRSPILEETRFLSNISDSVNPTDGNPDKDKPVKFSTSPAANWRAEFSRSGTSSTAPDAQTYIVAASLTAFLVYFFYLREENDIDEMLGISLYEKIDGLEEIELRVLYDYNLKEGKDNTDVIQRLAELEQKKVKS